MVEVRFSIQLSQQFEEVGVEPGDFEIIECVERIIDAVINNERLDCDVSDTLELGGNRRI